MRQRDEQNETGVGQLPFSGIPHKRQTVTDKRRITHEVLKASYNAESSDEEEEELSEEEEVELIKRHRFGNALKNSIVLLFPGWTPILMFATLIVVTLFVTFSNASKGYTPDFRFYGTYLGMTAGLFLAVLLARLLWILIFGRRLGVFSGRIYAALVTVLDPEFTYLIATITIAVFWSSSLDQIDPNQTGPTIKYYLFHNPQWTYT